MLKIDAWDSKFFDSTIGKLLIPGKIGNLSLRKTLADCAEAAALGKVSQVILICDPTGPQEQMIAGRGFKCYGERVDLLLRLEKGDCIAETAGHRVRVFKKSDLPAIQEIAGNAFRLSYLYKCGFGSRKKVDRYHAVWIENLSRNKDNRLFVVEENKHILGFVALAVDRNNRRARIALIAVNRRFRRAKVGTALIHKCIVYCRDKMHSLCVRTQKDNYHAIALYQKMGFRITKCEKIFCKKI